MIIHIEGGVTKKKLIAKIWTILMKKSMEFILVKFQISSV